MHMSRPLLLMLRRKLFGMIVNVTQKIKTRYKGTREPTLERSNLILGWILFIHGDVKNSLVFKARLHKHGDVHLPAL
jgi:hypothetical protein